VVVFRWPFWRARPEPIVLAALGDSLTAGYQGRPYSGPHQSWTDLFGSLRPGSIRLCNLAVPGTTSEGLLLQGQHTAAAGLVRAGQVRFVTLLIGANDVVDFVDRLPSGRAEVASLVAGLVRNLTTAVDTIRTAGTAGLVLASVPDIGSTPCYRQAFAGRPEARRLVTQATQAINAQLLAVARARALPVIDLHGLNELPWRGKVVVGGLGLRAGAYSVDGFHPSTLGQGLIANAILEALRRAYGVDASSLRFSDAELLAAQGLGPGLATFFDVHPFVLWPAAEPSGLTPLDLGGAALAWDRLPRRDGS
jgi:lysophospholipase L1-like esterase